MQAETLKYIADVLADANIPYDFMEYGDSVALVEQYFVGEYQEQEALNEDGMNQSQFILTGTGKSYLVLEVAKQKIKELFPPIVGRLATLENGSNVVIYYGNALNIPTGDALLKRIQINLIVKEWKGNIA